MPTIEDFDDDTDFALPSPPSAATGSSSVSGMPNIPGMPSMTPEQMQAFQQMMSQGGGGGPGGMGMGMAMGTGSGPSSTAGAPAEAKEWISLYPIYFDAKRSHKTGERRVAWKKSCLYPHSLGLAKALHKLGLRSVHEPGKTHPRDWENPGRVKVKLFDAEGNPIATLQSGQKKVENRRQLLEAVAPVLQEFCGGPPPVELPKREKKASRTRSKKDKSLKSTADTPSKINTKSSKTTAPSTTTSKVADTVKAAAGPSKVRPAHRLPNAGSSCRLAKLQRNHLLRSHLPPAHVRLPPHSPALSANLLNMDLNQAMGGGGGVGGGGGAPGGLPGMGGPPGGSAPNPMGALGSMMGNLGFGQEEEDEEGENGGDTEEERRKKAQNDPFKGMGRRGRKRVVRVGR